MTKRACSDELFPQEFNCVPIVKRCSEMTMERGLSDLINQIIGNVSASCYFYGVSFGDRNLLQLVPNQQMMFPFQYETGFNLNRVIDICVETSHDEMTKTLFIRTSDDEFCVPFYFGYENGLKILLSCEFPSNGILL